MTSNVDRQADLTPAPEPYDFDAMPDPGVGALRLVKPRMRGWLHAGVTPAACVAGLILVTHTTSSAARAGSLIFLASAVLLFGTSAVFHCRNWNPPSYRLLRRIDHSNIYLFIAASYTPYALCLLSGASRGWLLTLVWTAAVAGLLFRTLWLSAPRWLYTLMYGVMGLSAAAWLPQFLPDVGPGIFAMMLGSGFVYSVGAVVYAVRWPNPAPRWFGYHEVFHACTVAAFALQYVALSAVAAAD
ncbi:DNA-binding protein [Microlunatus endophyticus]|uniref:DNA-binding protein n=1 Tax=Microlunatus endophyticus TaxID=1716077 RepID=A0A917RZD8_9ACTN|nr:hemolysin III family protein [Microlunatus endophyticus]GGL46839.1 DNA-binding protein [Microlunatus endophyticus]